MSKIWKSLFDVRKGEYSRTLSMSLYLLFVMVAYYILKPVSAAMFLNTFNIDKLPVLYMLIAGGGGALAYFYTKIALKSSLRIAVFWTMCLSVISLVAFWWLIGLNLPWLLYVFNVWVSLFSIVLMSQGWLVAANVFHTREAKRLYGLLGLGAVMGAAIGSAVTKLTVKLIGTRNLILACAWMVILAYIAFLSAVRRSRESIASAKAAKAEKTEFSARDIFTSIGRYRHLQVIIAIILLTFIVDEMVDFQFQAMAKQIYRGNQLTAFFGSFYLYLNIIALVLQFFFTAWVVRIVGVGGTLQIMPVSIAAASIGAVLAPGLISSLITRFAEAVNRYTFNKTGMELLYLPLPVELRNRTKAFVDIFVDRAGRGLAGVLLGTLLWSGMRDLRVVAGLTIAFAIAWMLLARRAQHEYLGTVRARIERRRLDLDSARVPVDDPATLALLEQTVESDNPRQAAYALSLLTEAVHYDLNPVLLRLASRPDAELRGKVYEVAWFVRFEGLFERALSEIQSARPDDAGASLKPAVIYVLSFSTDATSLAKQLMDNPNPLIAESALEAVRTREGWAGQLISDDWLAAAIHDPDPQRRCLAAFAIEVRGDQSTAVLQKLLKDESPGVAAAACRAAGSLRNRACVDQIVGWLAEPAVRGPAIDALASFGTSITGYLGDFLADTETPAAIRRQIPRVLKLVPDQRSVDVLLNSIAQFDLSIRAAVLKALNTLRETAPNLDYGETFVTEQILNEARHYFELYSALEPIREKTLPRTATALLARTIEERLQQTLERLFRLLGLRYSPSDMHAAYLAVQRRRQDQFLAALEFLDTVLERPLKRVLLPMLDSSDRLVENGRELFGVEVRDAESAISELVGSSDPWLAACAMATAAERKLHKLTPEITRASQRWGAEIAEVGQTAVRSLAAGGVVA